VHWDLRNVRVFIAVAEALHFGEAARWLNVAQSAVSRAVRSMEEDLKVQLLVRSTRNVALTAEGALLLHECRQILDQFEKSIKRARSISAGLAGELDIGCNDFAFLAELPLIVQEFRRRFPEIAIRLHEGHRSAQLEAIAKGELDSAFVIGPINAEEFSAITTGSYRLAALVSKTHPLADRRRIRLRDLAGEAFIFGSRAGWQTYRAIMDSVFLGAGFDAKVIQEAYGSTGIFGLVAAGLGISIYPDCQLETHYRNFSVRPLVDVDRRVETAAAWHPRTLTLPAGHFVEFLQDYCGAARAAKHSLTRGRSTIRTPPARKP
jgi:DNA-binding transcriptional LysR family regulator